MTLGPQAQSFDWPIVMGGCRPSEEEDAQERLSLVFERAMLFDEKDAATK